MSDANNPAESAKRRFRDQTAHASAPGGRRRDRRPSDGDGGRGGDAGRGEQQPESRAKQMGKQAATKAADSALASATGGVLTTKRLKLIAKVAAVVLVVVVMAAVLMLALFFGDDIEYAHEDTDAQRAEDGIERIVPEDNLEAYQHAASRHDVPWTVVAGVAATATDHGRSSPYRDDECTRPSIDRDTHQLPAEQLDWRDCRDTLEAHLDAAGLEGEAEQAAGLSEDDFVENADLLGHQPTNPPIGSPDTTERQGLGPFLLTPETAVQHGWDPEECTGLTGAGDDCDFDPQDVEQAADVVAEAIARSAAQLEFDGQQLPREIDHSNVAEFDAFWAAAVNGVGDVLADPDGDYVTCALPSFEPDEPEQVGTWVERIWLCEAADVIDEHGQLHVVTDVEETGGGVEYHTAEAAHAAQLLAEEALRVSWEHSEWDTEGCDPDADLAGVFPLPDGLDDDYFDVAGPPGGRRPAADTPDGDRCDVKENVTAAARLVITAEATPPEQRSGTPGERAAGGWRELDWALGDEASQSLVADHGAHGDLRAHGECRALLGNLALTSAAVDGEAFAEWRGSAPPALEGGGDEDLERALANVGLVHSDLTGSAALADSEECGDLPDLDEHEWRQLIAAEVLELHGLISQDLLAQSDEGVGGPGDSPDEPVELDGRSSEAVSAVEDELGRALTRDELEDMAGALEGMRRYLFETSGWSPTAEPGDVLVKRLNPLPQQYEPHPHPERMAATERGMLNSGERAVATAVDYGGIHPDDPRADGAGRLGIAGRVPNCDTLELPSDEALLSSRALTAQTIYEVFYCEGLVHGLEGEPPNASADYGFANKAQQVASEAVVVAWCESGGFEAADHGGTYAGLFQIGAGEFADYGPDGGSRTSPTDNIRAAANYFYAGHGSLPWDGWRPWAVVNTDLADFQDAEGNMPNYGVRYPPFQRFASTHPEHSGERTSASMPAWALNPYQERFPTYAETNGCRVLNTGETWPELDFVDDGLPGGELADIRPSAPGDMVCPVQGITRYWNDWHQPRGGGTRLHLGNDLFAPTGNAIYAPVDGVISYRRDETRDVSGQIIAVDPHDSDERWLFMHNDTNIAPALADVRAGEVIATVGRTGFEQSNVGAHAHVAYEPVAGGGYANPYHILSRVCPTTEPLREVKPSALVPSY